MAEQTKKYIIIKIKYILIFLFKQIIQIHFCYIKKH